MTRTFRGFTYFVGLATFFSALYFAPELLRKKTFEYPVGQQGKPALNTFPLDKNLVSITAKGPGKTSKLSELASRRTGGILVNFWATWCPPCLEELPSLERLNRQLSQSGDTNLPLLVTISVDDHLKEILNLYATLSFQPSFLVLHDPGAVFAESIGSTRFPETYWVGSDGSVKQKWLGPQDWESDAVLRRLASH